MSTTVALVGGPCDGKTINISDATLAAGYLTCSGTLYQRTDAIHVGDLITFATKAAITGVGGGVLSDLFKGWHDLRQSVNKHMPAALHHSEQQGIRALHALGRARKVKL